MLHGRGREQAYIERVLGDAHDSRSRRLLLTGPAGIGKTAMLDAAEEQARQAEMCVLRASGAPSDAELPYAGLYDLLRPVFDVVDRLPERQRDALQAALGRAPASAVERFAVCTGTLAVLAAVAEKAPCLVLVDDLHWLDTASADAILFAVRRLRADAVAVVAALRAGEGRALVLHGFEEIELTGLDEEQTGQLLGENVGAVPPPPLLHELMVRTEGNPLALKEWCRILDRETLTTHPTLPTTLPMGLSAGELFRRRVAALGEESTSALLLAGLADTEDAGVMWRAAEALGIPPDPFQRLEAEGLVRVHSGRPWLTHPLVRAAVEEVAAPELQRAYHHALADALRGRAEDHRWAWHRAAAASAPDESVAAALEQAADRACARSAFASAMATLERAAQLSIHDRERARRLMRAGTAARLAGHPTEAFRLLGAARALATDPILHAEIACEQGRNHLYHGRAHDARSLMASAAESLRDHAPADAAAMYGQAAFAALITGDPLESVQLARRGGTLVDREAAGNPVIALTLGMALLHLGQVGTSLETLRDAAEAALAKKDSIDPDYLSFAALALNWVGDYGRARQILAACVPEARASSAFGVLCSALYASASLEARTGHLLLAYATAEEGLRIAESSTNDLWSFFLRCALAYVEAARGREEQCREHAQAAQATAQAMQISYSLPLFDALGLLELSLGRAEAAIPHLEAATGLSGRNEPVMGRPTSADLVEAYARAGHEVPAHLREQLAAMAADDRFPGPAGLAQRCLGLLAPAPAYLEHFEAALRLQERGDNPFALARTELCFGERLRREGQRILARTHLQRACDAFDATGASAWAGRAREELRATGATAPQRKAPSLTALTPQELQVALAAAGGARNREIAASLFLSPKTVEFHLTQIYRKLGVRTRAQLGTVLAAQRSAKSGTPVRLVAP